MADCGLEAAFLTFSHISFAVLAVGISDRYARICMYLCKNHGRTMLHMSYACGMLAELVNYPVPANGHLQRFDTISSPCLSLRRVGRSCCIKLHSACRGARVWATMSITAALGELPALWCKTMLFHPETTVSKSSCTGAAWPRDSKYESRTHRAVPDARSAGSR